jgi:hypothetical protein
MVRRFDDNAVSTEIHCQWDASSEILSGAAHRPSQGALLDAEQ